MNEFERLREDVLSAYVMLLGLVSGRLAATRRSLLDASRNRLAEGHFYVVVCGEFRRGKSSLLNALVERPGLFPVDVDVTTCAVVTLQWNDRDSAVVHFSPTDTEKPVSARPPQSIPVARAAEFVTEQANPGNAKNVLKIEMGAPIPQLKSGLVLVDTPGIGSVNTGHTAATRAFLPNADAILFVASAVEPLSAHELDFLELALSQCKIVVTALTRMDEVVDAGPVVREARTLIASKAGADPDKLVIVPVSSHRKRDALEDRDPELLADSGFGDLQAALWGGLAITCGAAQVRAALGAMYEALAEAAAPLENELAALRGDAEKVADQLRTERERARKLKASSHGWRRDLQEDVDRMARPILRRLDKDLEEINDHFRRALNTGDALHNASTLVQQLSDAMVDAANRASSGLEDNMRRLADKYAAITELAISVAGVPVSVSDPSFSADLPKMARKPQAYARFREMWLGGSAGSAAGSFAGMLAGMALGTTVPVAGTLIGGAIGLMMGLFGARQQYQRNMEEQQRRTYVADLRANVLPKLEAGRRRLTGDLAEQIRDYGRTLAKRLEDEVTARSDSLDESIRSLDEARQRGGHGQAQRQHDLAKQYDEFARMRAELDRLRDRADRLSRDQSGRPGLSGTSASR